LRWIAPFEGLKGREKWGGVRGDEMRGWKGVMSVCVEVVERKDGGVVIGLNGIG
jgi:hypothetical protein